MTAVFIHGNPDTWRVWDPVIANLESVESVALALPGFGCPVNQGFQATKEEYVAWVIDQLERQSAPVHLVGHDWGSLLTQRVASTRPDLVASWTGGGGTVRTVKTWHELARIWQTPGAGERWMEAFDTDARTTLLTQLGVDPASARDAASRVDGVMRDCILKLYRSAVHVGVEWELDLSNLPARGLLIWGENDPLRVPGSPDSILDDASATIVLFAGCGHWWQIQRPRETAAALLKHWSGAAH